MMGCILVLTDFSDSALNAAFYAVRLAGTFDNCRIILYHSFSVAPMEGILYDLMDADASRKENISKLEDIATSLEPFLKPGTSIEYRTNSSSLTVAAETIARTESVDFVIAGAKTHPVTERFLFGTNIGILIDKFPLPLVVVPNDAIYEPVQSVAFACELKDVENIPVGNIRTMIRHFNCKFDILNIDTRKQDKIDAQTLLEQEKLHGLMDDLRPDYHYINHPDIAEGIRQFVAEWQIDLLIVIPKKHGFFHNLLQGSTTRKLALHASVPLFVVKEKL